MNEKEKFGEIERIGHSSTQSRAKYIRIDTKTNPDPQTEEEWEETDLYRFVIPYELVDSADGTHKELVTEFGDTKHEGVRIEDGHGDLIEPEEVGLEEPPEYIIEKAQEVLSEKVKGHW